MSIKNKPHIEKNPTVKRLRALSEKIRRYLKGENLPQAGTPESFNVLVRELQGLGLKVKLE